MKHLLRHATLAALALVVLIPLLLASAGGAKAAAAPTFIVAVDEYSRLYYVKSNGDGTWRDYRYIDYVGGWHSRGVTLNDFDNDGDLDIIGVRDPWWGNYNYYLFLNDGSDNFIRSALVGAMSISSDWPEDMATGDFNNDGNQDFIAGGDSARVGVFLGDGHGAFTKTEVDLEGSLGRGVDVADFDNDGNADFVRAVYDSGNVRVYWGDGTGAFSLGASALLGTPGDDPYGIVAGDFNNDGFVDIISNSGGSGDTYLWTGNGDRTFDAEVAVPSLDQNNHGGFDAFDFDGDGNLDVVADNYSGRTVYYYAGNGDGTFDAAVSLGTTPENAMAIAAPPMPAPAGVPSAAISPASQSVAVGAAANFDPSASADADGAIESYDWDWGDGTAHETGAGAPTVTGHSYTAEGLYTVKLKVTDNDGKSDFASARVSVTGGAPAVDQTPVSFSESQADHGVWPLTLDAATYASDAEAITSYAWSTVDGDSEDFEDGNDAGWTKNRGTWAVTDTGPIAGAYSYRQSDAGQDRTWNLFNQDFGSDVTVEADVRMLAGGGQEAHLLFRAQNPANNYYFILRGRGYNDVLLYRRVNDGDSNIYEYDLPYAIANDTTYHLKVVTSGTRIELYLDGALMFTTWDSQFSSGRVGLSTYYTDALFDNLVVTSTGSAATFPHTFTPGAHDVSLTVTDAAGQTATGVIPMTMQVGTAPVADAGGPYTAGEAAASAGGWTVALDGSGSSDDVAVQQYVWDLGTDTFDGTVISDGKWVYSGAAQNDEMTISSTVNNWGYRYLFSKDTYTRADGMAFEARVKQASGYSHVMVGLKNTTSTYHYTHMPYAFYFADGGLRIHEDGSERTYLGGYGRDTWYDVRIELKPTAGARYYIRASGSPTWTLLYDSNYGTATEFKRGMDVHSGTFTIDDLKEIAAGATPSYRLYGVGDHPISLTAYDRAGQSHTDSATVTLTADNPPAPDAGPDQALFEADATDGVWTVNFDAGASTDDHGIYMYEWDWDYDGVAFQPSGITGETVEHSWTAPGTYTVAVRAWDHALQTAVDPLTVTITAGAVPVADANGPYLVNEVSGNALEGGWTATLSGAASSDDRAIAKYVWDFGTETFDGTVFDTGKWAVSSLQHVSQNNALSMSGVWGWGSRYVFSKDTYARAKGMAFEAKVQHTGGNVMVGFKNTSATYHYSHMPYAIYLEGTNVRIYEDGSDRGVYGTYSYNTPYDIRIELKETAGARYYMRPSGAGAWTLLYDSDYGAATEFKRGFDVYYGTFTIDDLKEIAGGPSPSYRFYGMGSHTVSLTVWDHAGQSDTDYTSVTTAGSNAPVPAAGPDRVASEADAFENTWTLNFDGSASTDDHGILKYEWDFGDGASDTFEDGDAAGWTSYAGTWAVTDTGPIAGAYSYRQTDAALGRAYTLFGQTFGRNPGLSVEADVMLVGGSGLEAQLVFGAQDQNNAYEFILRGRGGTDDILFYRKQGGGDTNLYEYDLPFDVVAGTIYHLKAVLSALQVDIYLDGKYLFTVTDAYYPAGKVGFSTYQTDATFDNLVVKSIATTAGAQHTFRAPGVYTVTLRVTDHALQSAIDTATVTLTNGSAPVANAGPDQTTEGIWPASFNGGGSTDDIGIYKYVWDFGDGHDGVGKTAKHTYWANGDYNVTLTVYDNALQSSSDTLLVHVVEGLGPTANAGGPYNAGAGGPPAYYNGSSSTDDHGIVKYLWDADDAVDSDSDGNFTNDIDAVGHKPFYTYSTAGVYAVTLTVVDGYGHTSTDTAIVNVATNLAPDVIAVPWVAANPLAPHETYNGFNARLKAIVRDAGDLTYQWDFGDGSAPTTVAPVTDKYAIEADHVYPDSPDNTPYTATLTVWDGAGLFGTDQYYVIVRPDNADTRANIAIDDGLWWLHKAQDRNDGKWVSYGSYYTSSTGSTLQSFEINGHLEDGDNQEDPYVETVRRGFNFLFTRIRVQPLTVEPAGNPDSNGNGIGLSANESEDGYQLGMIMDAIASSGTPLAFALTGPENVNGRYYYDLLTDMVDMYAWSQADAGGWGRGGWRYLLYDYQDSDNSAAQWGAIGMQAAEDSFDINIPQWVKDENNDYWLNYTYNTSVGLFGYSYPGDIYPGATPGALVQLAFDDRYTSDVRWRTAEDYYANNWASIVSGGPYYLWDRGGYPVYAFTKAMRLAQPDPVTHFQATGLDWYNDPTWGIRKLVLDKQVTSGGYRGAWSVNQNVGTVLASAWHVIMLTPTLFVQPPVADAGTDIIWAYDMPLRFDASGSFHMDPSLHIVSYQWDFGDGSQPFTSADPYATYTYPDPNPGVAGDSPTVYMVVLRVTDDAEPPQSDIDTREVTVAEPPHAPFADAGGPYHATAGIPFTLNGSGSHDIDPGDSITKYQWDLDGAPWFDNVELDVATVTATWTYSEPGTYTIGLIVRDAGAFNQPSCTIGQDCIPMDSEPAFTTVTVSANLAPVAEAGGPYTVPEATQVTLDGSASSDPNWDRLTYAWDLDGDGEYDDSTAQRPTFTWTDNGVHTVGLKVSDSLLESTDTATVTVTNVRPTVDAGYDATIDEGGTYGYTGQFLDPGADTWTATVNYGDGAGPVALALDPGKTFVLSHTYADNGVFTVTVTVTDDEDGTHSDAAIVTVRNVTPVVDAGPDASLPGAGAFTGSGSFADPGADTWTATVNYDNGSGATPLALTGKTFNLSHAYAASGTFIVTVCVKDDENAEGCDTLTVSIAAPTPTPTPTPTATATPTPTATTPAVTPTNTPTPVPTNTPTPTAISTPTPTPTALPAPTPTPTPTVPPPGAVPGASGPGLAVLAGAMVVLALAYVWRWRRRVGAAGG